MRERNESRISIEGVEAPVMKQLIEYTYTSEISIDTDNAQQLLSAANMMQVASIIDACCTCVTTRPQVDASVWKTRGSKLKSPRLC